MKQQLVVSLTSLTMCSSHPHKVQWQLIMLSMIYAQSFNHGLELLSRAIHWESQPHQWAISLNTLWEGSPESGGSFYFAKYRVQVLQATNTLIAFKPSDAHGTSLLHRSPADTAWDNGSHQMGLAIVSSPWLASAFVAYKKGLLKEEEAKDDLEEKEGNVEYEWENRSAEDESESGKGSEDR